MRFELNALYFETAREYVQRWFRAQFEMFLRQYQLTATIVEKKVWQHVVQCENIICELIMVNKKQVKTIFRNAITKFFVTSNKTWNRL